MSQSLFENPVSAAVDRQILHVGVAAKLRDMIVEGELEAGTRLNERVLCERLLVSRTPLREAFKVLASDGLIELVPNRGAVVVRLSIADIKQTFEVMAGLEAMSGELACARISEVELSELQALHYEMLACHKRKDLPGYYRCNRQIHYLINAAARNVILQEIYQKLNLRIQALRFRSNFEQSKWDMAVDEHQAMLEALSRRDALALRDIMQRHLLNKRDVVVGQLEKETILDRGRSLKNVSSGKDK